MRQAVILAGGRGARLRPLTDTIPKPMIPILGKPFLSYIFDILRENNIKEVIILVGYLHEVIEKYFGDGRKFGLRIRYSYSPPETETGTRIVSALPMIDQKFLLLYADNIWPLKLHKLLKTYYQRNVGSQVTVYSNIDKATKNNMQVDAKGLIVSYDRQRRAKNLNGVDIGFFILDKKVFANSPKINFSFEDELLPKLIKARQLGAYFTNHKYYGLSTLDRIPKIESYCRSKKVVFLDRDGVINKRPSKGEYITKWEEFAFLPGVQQALTLLQKKGYEIYIVSNQAGIGRGIVTRHQVDEVNNRMRHELEMLGVKISDIFICPHSWDEGCFCRKPSPGLFFQAASKYDINLYNSYCIGDDVRDIQAGTTVGCKSILIGEGQKIKSLYDAVKLL